MGKDLKISDYTGVTPRFLRSINLFNDWHNPDNFSGYIVTPNVAQSMERLLFGLLSSEGQRAFALIGPYGTGKSAFTVFLCQLFSRKENHFKAAQKQIPVEFSCLEEQSQEVCTREKVREGFLPIIVTARRRPIAQLILEGMMSAVSILVQTKQACDLLNRMQEALDKRYWHDTATILEFLKATSLLASEQKYAGVLLLVDEAGKTLEYALQDRSGGDVYIFQEIAEYANRSREIPLLFLITLHQMFDDYVELSDRTLRNEWTKVQERFQSIQFNESAATTIQMVATALQPSRKLPEEITLAIEEALTLLKTSSVKLPLGIEFSDFADMAKRAWPIHPSVLLAMPHLFRRLAQNERSIFSYLTSHEPFGFQEQLQQPLGKADNFVRLHHLYAYLLANFEVSLARLPHAKRLLEANDIINSRQNLTISQLQLIQSVALLNVLGEICPLKATIKLLACASIDPNTVEQELEFLKKQSIVTYRRLDGSYRVWEGSDVDIEARMKEARRKLHIESKSLFESLSRQLPDMTFVARRHSLETGVHRFFNVCYAESVNKYTLQKSKPNNDAAGSILVLLPQADPTALISKIRHETTDKERIIVALPRQIDALRGVVEEVACLRWVEENTDELRDDRVARRELSLRLAQGEQRISQLLQILLDPRPAPVGNSCQWFWKGQEQSPRRPSDITKLLSHACDYIYHLGPSVRNELVVRRKLSAAASSARRCLLERMLNNSIEECLGIDGYPAERSVYESVLKTTGMHYFDQKAGHWRLQAPPIDNPTDLWPSWELMEKEVFSDPIHRVELADLFDKLADVPFGLPDGIHPILFTAFYLVFQDELFLYRENSFIPDIQIVHLELLQRRPDLFSISGARLTGTRKAVVERLAIGLQQPAKTASVVRALFRILKSLPPVTLKSTKHLHSEAIQMRDCLLIAHSPEELIFVDLPKCFGISPFMQNEERAEDMELFFDRLNSCLLALQNHTEDLQKNSRNLLLNKCGLPDGDLGWKELERRTAWMATRVNHEVLTPFLNCVINGIRGEQSTVAALSLVANRPFEQWTDLDFERFPGLADGIGGIFQQAWHNYGDSGPKLTEKELKEKNQLRMKLEPQLSMMRKQNSSKALVAALRELLNEIEKVKD
jgi:hypothetical protein